jgi:osmotically-inducible protein OsmY
MDRQAINPVAIVAGGFTGGVLAMLLLERVVARAQRVAPARPAARASGYPGSEDDAQLRERVRSRLGDWVSHPGAISVDVENGVVRVSGQVLVKELDGLLSRITGVAGVRKVHNALDALSDPSGFGEVPQGRSTEVTY